MTIYIETWLDSEDRTIHFDNYELEDMGEEARKEYIEQYVKDWVLNNINHSYTWSER